MVKLIELETLPKQVQTSKTKFRKKFARVKLSSFAFVLVMSLTLQSIKLASISGSILPRSCEALDFSRKDHPQAGEAEVEADCLLLSVYHFRLEENYWN